MNYPSNHNESHLVRSLSKGEIFAFNALYHKYCNRIYRFALGYLKTEEEAEELVQEVFFKIWEKRKELKEDLSFKSFLFTIAFNLIRKHFRTKALISEYFRTVKKDDSDLETSQNIVYNSLHQYISDLVDRLPERRKEIFLKSRFEGLSIKEIAEVLKINHKTVENQLTAALKFIRSNINEESIAFVIFSTLLIS
jgi:RNA polymerase sigma-70 factor (family 1)